MLSPVRLDALVRARTSTQGLRATVPGTSSSLAALTLHIIVKDMQYRLKTENIAVHPKTEDHTLCNTR